MPQRDEALARTCSAVVSMMRTKSLDWPIPVVVPQRNPMSIDAHLASQQWIGPQAENRIDHGAGIIPGHFKTNLLRSHQIRDQRQRRRDHWNAQRAVLHDLGRQAHSIIRQVPQQTQPRQRTTDAGQRNLAGYETTPAEIPSSSGTLQRVPCLRIRSLADHLQRHRAVRPTSQLPTDLDHGVAAAGHRHRAEIAHPINTGRSDGTGHRNRVRDHRMRPSEPLLIGVFSQQQEVMSFHQRLGPAPPSRHWTTQHSRHPRLDR